MCRIMTKQGVRGPPFKFLLGQYTDMLKISESFPETLAMVNLANFSPTVTPQYAMYFPNYGNIFLHWRGTDMKLVADNPEVVKEMLITNHDSLVRSELENMLISQLVVQELLTQESENWSSERRTIDPSFNQDALKAMVEAMVQGGTSEIQIWKQNIELHKESRLY